MQVWSGLEDDGYFDQIDSIVLSPVVEEEKLSIQAAEKKLINLQKEFQTVLRLEHAGVKDLIKTKNDLLTQSFKAALDVPVHSDGEEAELTQQKKATVKGMLKEVLKLERSLEQQKKDILTEMLLSLDIYNIEVLLGNLQEAEKLALISSLGIRSEEASHSNASEYWDRLITVHITEIVNEKWTELDSRQNILIEREVSTVENASEKLTKLNEMFERVLDLEDAGIQDLVESKPGRLKNLFKAAINVPVPTGEVEVVDALAQQQKEIVENMTSIVSERFVHSMISDLSEDEEKRLGEILSSTK